MWLHQTLNRNSLFLIRDWNLSFVNSLKYFRIKPNLNEYLLRGLGGAYSLGHFCCWSIPRWLTHMLDRIAGGSQLGAVSPVLHFSQHESLYVASWASSWQGNRLQEGNGNTSFWKTGLETGPASLLPHWVAQSYQKPNPDSRGCAAIPTNSLLLSPLRDWSASPSFCIFM